MEDPLADPPEQFPEELWRDLAGLDAPDLTALAERSVTAAELVELGVLRPRRLGAEVPAGTLVAIVEGGVALGPGGLEGRADHVRFGARADRLLVRFGAGDTALIDPDQEGVRIEPTAARMGGGALAEASITFDGVAVRAGSPVPPGSEDGDRRATAAIAVGLAQAAFALALERAGGDEALSASQVVRWKLADVAIALDGARVLLERAVADERDPALAAAALLAALEAAELATREAIQIEGPAGYTRARPLERLYREARGLSLGAGSPERARTALARRVLGYETAEPPELLPALAPELEALRARVAELAEANAPDAARWDEEESFPESSFARMRDAGLFGLTLPERFGGRGRGVLEASIALEELARTCLSSAMIAQVYFNGPQRAIATLASDEQRERWLPGTAEGDRFWSIAITEPQAGSAATEMESRLEPEGDGYRLYGGKCYITGGMRANTFFVFCRLAGTRGAKGIAAVIVESHQEGFAPPVTQPKMGGRGVGETELRFEGIRIEPEAVIVAPDPQSSAGAAIMLRQFNPERCGNAAMSLGLARAALEDSRRHLRTRRQFGMQLGEFEGLQAKIADMWTRLVRARLLLHRAAGSDEEGFPVTRLTVTAKIHANEVARAVCDEAIQLHGHSGYTRLLPIERYYRDARGMSLGGGTTEVMRNVLAGELIGRQPRRRE
ncbi:MAG TPA: acyl-CoA dehydrogenase family protein [Solirubrobacteraceae bacterium]|jgi:hypothetical protein|nr:acyl-CoA dehydrogenase family protein [Solirubrobacteraceae bacterium]